MHMNMRKVMKCLEKSYVKFNILMTQDLSKVIIICLKRGATVLMKQSSKFSKEDGSL